MLTAINNNNSNNNNKMEISGNNIQENFENQIEFYKNMFNCDYEVLNIPKKDKCIGVSEEGNVDFNNYNQNIDSSLTNKINEYVRIHNIDKTSFFITIYGYILSKYSGQEVVYTSMLNVNNFEKDIMSRIFLNTLPLLLKYDNGNISFLNKIRENIEILLNINSHNISFSELTNVLNLKKINNNFIYHSKLDSFDNNISILKNEIKLKSNFDFIFKVIENQNSYTISIEYNKYIYDSKIIENIVKSYLEVIANINHFEDTLKSIEYIPKDEKEKIIQKFNPNINTIGSEKLYHEEISKIAKQYPSNHAIIFNEMKITYKELDEMTNSLAYYLRKQNVNRNDIIPIISDRSPFYIISSLGISKAGGAFIPVDPKFPIDRIQFILEECQPKVVLHNNAEKIIEKLDKSKFVFYDVKGHDFTKNTDEINNINEPNDTCYVLFTSGTTGKPKGTLIKHFNLYNFVRSYNDSVNECCMNNIFALNNVKNVLGLTNFSFCVSHMENIVSLVNGLRLILVDDIVSNDITLLSKYIIDNDVDFIITTPTRLNIFFGNEGFRNSLSHVKTVCFAGEKLSFELCKKIRKYFAGNIYNFYGLTECTAGCTFKKIIVDNENEPNENIVTIGKPLCSCKIYILDKDKRPVPIGVEGEIYIGGYSVGKGYLHCEELEKSRFIENPFNVDKDENNKVMYKTGDLGKWTFNGEINYLGRMDFQIKIHGQRIELTEIENTILEINGISQCVVVDKIKKDTGVKYLICYYTLNNEQNKIESEGIREYLKKKLPLYMIPNFYKQIYEIPLLNGEKVNKKALPEFEPSLNGLVKEEYVAPQSEIEKTICKIYSIIFKIPVEDISVMNAFHELGGDSLIAIKFVTEVNKLYNIKLSITDIMEQPSIRSLASLIEQKRNENSDQVGTIQKYDKDEFPITSLLSAFPYKIEDKKLIFALTLNMLVFYQLPKGTNIERLIESFNILLDRQEVLKTKFIINSEGDVVGKIIKNEKLKIEYYTMDNFEQFVRPFNLLTDKLLIRVGFINDPENLILMMDVDHRLGDGFSYGILIKELLTIYSGGVLKELPIQYSDYAIDYDRKIHSKEIENTVKFYKTVFNEPYQSLTLPKKENCILTSKAIESVFIRTDENTYNTVNNISKKYNVSKTALFLTVYSVVISMYSGENKNIFTTVLISNRMMPHTEELIGLFLRCIPILLKIENVRLIDLVKQCMKIILKAYSCDMPYTMISEELNLPPCNSVLQFDPYELKGNGNNANPNPNAPKVINLFEMFKKHGKENALFHLLNKNNILHPDIKWTVGEEKDVYTLLFKYNKNLYDESLVKDIINKFLYIIKDESNFVKNSEDIVNEMTTNNLSEQK
ncbi:hypothetical protein PIROE2DRAFT_7151 [Piromyces sp. E2]|nr:hypothetical protein PIROE2DRAFT_7151 [Piromyces sp. E2]|eukprot:OUM65738.1 hypothetical protein PIROE2DRAFT_7151 [Piromyces sp. E2]